MSGPDRPALRATLVQLRARVDAHFDAALARTPEAFACRAGCESCCHQRFGVFEVEAAPVREALARLARTDPALRARVRAQADDPAHQHHCALLVEGRCAIYDERPLICRSHGLPVLADGRVDHCPLNFTETSPPAASTLRLDAVNQPLVVLDALWTRAGGGLDEGDLSGARVDLADLARADDSAGGGPGSPFRR